MDIIEWLSGVPQSFVLGLILGSILAMVENRIKRLKKGQK